MKFLLIVGTLVVSLLIGSCGKEAPPPLSPEQIRMHIDSVVAEKVRDAELKAAADLEHRIKIEVKVKADSILHTMMHKSYNDTPAH